MYAPKRGPLRDNMFIQNMTLSAQTVSPLDHFHGLIRIVTVRPSASHSRLLGQAEVVVDLRLAVAAHPV